MVYTVKKTLRLALWFVPAYMTVCLLIPLYTYTSGKGTAYAATALLLYAVLGVVVAMRFPALRAATWKTALAALWRVMLGLAILYFVVELLTNRLHDPISPFFRVFYGWESSLLASFTFYSWLPRALVLLLTSFLAPLSFYGGVLIGKALRRED